WAAHDPATGQVYVAIRDPAQILAISAADLTAGAALPVPAAGPHGLWADGQRLYCAADAGALVVLDRDTGTVLASLPRPGAPDVIMHNAALGHLYIAVGDPGVIAVADTSALEIIEQVPAEPGAHTLGIDPGSRTVYAFLPASSGAAVYQDS